MENDLAQQLASLWDQAFVQARLMLLPSRLYQIGILLLCFLVAWLLNRWISPPAREWMRTLEGRPKWQLRALLNVHRRLFLIIFALLWLGVLDHVIRPIIRILLRILMPG